MSICNYFLNDAAHSLVLGLILIHTQKSENPTKNFPIKGTWIGLVLPQAGFEPSDESMQIFELV